MIIYKAADWWSAILHFHTTQVIRTLFLRVLVVGLYGLVVAVTELEYFHLSPEVNREYFSFLGILLSLLLAFRTNTAYDRFYEGRKLWGQLVNESRNLAVALHALLLKTDHARRVYYAGLISNFAIALEGHLREGVAFDKLEEVDGLLADLRQVEHVPSRLAAVMQEGFEDLQRQQLILPVHLLSLKPHHQALLEITGACERIKKTPIPFSYNFFIKTFITVFIIAMPFVLLNTYGYFMIPITMFGGYALLGVEMIGDEIEDPFGRNANDLPLAQLANNIRVNVHEILGVPLPNYKKALAVPQYSVVY